MTPMAGKQQDDQDAHKGATESEKPSDKQVGNAAGTGVDKNGLPNKRITVDSSLMSQVLNGDILFENVYSGYEGQWERFPTDVYNRDIVMFVVMYSYVYQNRLAKTAPPLRAPA